MQSRYVHAFLFIFSLWTQKSVAFDQTPFERSSSFERSLLPFINSDPLIEVTLSVNQIIHLDITIKRITCIKVNFFNMYMYVHVLAFHINNTTLSLQSVMVLQNFFGVQIVNKMLHRSQHDTTPVVEPRRVGTSADTI